MRHYIIVQCRSFGGWRILLTETTPGQGFSPTPPEFTLKRDAIAYANAHGWQEW